LNAAMLSFSSVKRGAVFAASMAVALQCILRLEGHALLILYEHCAERPRVWAGARCMRACNMMML
jgi:hypothetical protein